MRPVWVKILCLVADLMGSRPSVSYDQLSRQQLRVSWIPTERDLHSLEKAVAIEHFIPINKGGH